MQRGLTFLRLIIRFLRLHSVDVLFVAKDASRTYEYRSRRYSPIFDTLREQFEASGARCLTISPPSRSLRAMLLTEILLHSGPSSSCSEGGPLRLCCSRPVCDERLRTSAEASESSS
jgi:hypothetical protein